eukprot:TRINITY_DN6518_c0_g1_i2.p1 TRINITY_DN6518_c0_g1~~TRINITY_DN6518_c0_g1_i2.p1  ORF type:complete len:556 (+),score=108.83 TRINITY_DN6518_c0_g1_i2:61-1668(+)
MCIRDSMGSPQKSMIKSCNQEIKHQHKKTSMALQVQTTIIILFVALAISNGIISYLIMDKKTKQYDPLLSAYKGVLQFQENNQRGEPITDIKLIPKPDAPISNQTADVKCPWEEGYNSDFIFRYQRPVSFCNCSGVLTRKYCSEDQERKGCRTTYGAGWGADEKFWNKVLVCVKKARMTEKVNGACLPGYKLLPTNLCVNETDPVPISDFRFALKSAPVPQGWEGKSFNETHSLIFNRDEKKQPIYSLFATMNGRPCINPERQQTRQPGQDTWFLEDNDIYAGCDEAGENDFATEYLDQERELQAFNDSFYLTSDTNLDLDNYLKYHQLDNLHLYAYRRLKVSDNEICQVSYWRSMLEWEWKAFDSQMNDWWAGKIGAITLGIICIFTLLPIPILKRGQPSFFHIFLFFVTLYDVVGVFWWKIPQQDDRVLGKMLTQDCFEFKVKDYMWGYWSTTNSYYKEVPLRLLILLAIDTLIIVAYILTEIKATYWKPKKDLHSRIDPFQTVPKAPFIFLQLLDLLLFDIQILSFISLLSV